MNAAGFYLVLLALFILTSILNAHFLAQTILDVNRKPSIKAAVKRNLDDKLKVSNAEILDLLVASCPPANAYAFSYAHKLHRCMSYRSRLLISENKRGLRHWKLRSRMKWELLKWLVKLMRRRSFAVKVRRSKAKVTIWLHWCYMRQVGGSAPPSHCSASESESRSGGIQRLSPTADVAAPRRRPGSSPAERVSSPGNNAARTRPKTSCCCYRCCFCWRCQCNGSVVFLSLLALELDGLRTALDENNRTFLKVDSNIEPDFSVVLV